MRLSSSRLASSDVDAGLWEDKGDLGKGTGWQDQLEGDWGSPAGQTVSRGNGKVWGGQADCGSCSAEAGPGPEPGPAGRSSNVTGPGPAAPWSSSDLGLVLVQGEDADAGRRQVPASKDQQNFSGS